MSAAARPGPAMRRALATPEEVAQYLGVPIATLYQWRHRGIGPRGSKVGRHIRYSWENVEKWLDEQAGAAA